MTDWLIRIGKGPTSCPSRAFGKINVLPIIGNVNYSNLSLGYFSWLINHFWLEAALVNVLIRTQMLHRENVSLICRKMDQMGKCTGCSNFVAIAAHLQRIEEWGFATMGLGYFFEKLKLQQTKIFIVIFWDTGRNL